MSKNVKDLLRQIEEKNAVLNTLNHRKGSDKEKIRNVKTDLDRLLYLYLKALRRNEANYCV